MLKIDTVTVANPVDFSVGLVYKYGTEETNANGSVIADRIAVKRKIQVKWGLMTQTEMVALQSALNPTFFDLEYPDPELGVVTKEFKIDGELSSPKSLIYRSEVMWDGLSCNLIER
jgi:hypothetical protein